MAHRIELRARANQHFVYSGRSLLVTDLDGWLTGRGNEGFYADETRLLSRFGLTADGLPLKTIAASPVGGARFLAYAEVPKLARVPEQVVYAAVAQAVDEGMRTEIRLENYHTRDAAQFDLAITVAADFADINETKEGRRQQSGPVETHWDETNQQLVFRYGHPDLDRMVAVRVERAPAPVRFQTDALVVSLDLLPHRPAELHLAVEPIFDGARREAPSRVFGVLPTSLARVRQRLQEETPCLITTNPTVAR